MEQNEIVKGDRGDLFKAAIISLLNRAKLKQKYIDILTDKYSLSIYDIAFTDKSANPNNNYEFYEIIGDAAVNKSIVVYITKRFPQLAKPGGVEFISKLTSKLRSKEKLSSITKSLKLDSFVTHSTLNTKKTDMAEDVFESFIGATEQLIDQRIKFGAGYVIVYNIVESIFNGMEIPLTWEYLVDPITSLKDNYFLHKEFKDKNIGTYKYEELEFKNQLGNNQYVVIVNRIFKERGREIIEEIGRSTPQFKKQIARKIASERAINTLKIKGFVREPPEKFKNFIMFIN